MKRARYLSIKVGFIAPFHARIFTPGEGSQEMEPRIEMDLASLDEVRGFLVVVRPDAYIEEVRWDADGKFVAVSGPVENIGSLIARAIGELGSAKASCDLCLAPIERAELDAHIDGWKKTLAP